MLDQTTMNGRKPDRSPAAGVGRNLAGLTHDLICLGELQVQLLSVDLKEMLSRSILPIGLIVGALLLALGTMPVVLAGIGWLLYSYAGFSPGAAFLLVSLVALVLVGGAIWLGIRKLKSAAATLKRSQRELSDNVRWIKQALRHEGTRAEVYRQRV